MTSIMTFFFTLLAVPASTTCEVMMSEMILMVFFFQSKSLWAPWSSIMEAMNLSLFMDKISCSLVLLSLWVFSLVFLALKGPVSRNLFWLLSVLMLILYLLFQVSSVMAFFMLFELSVLPIVLIIYGWGYQPERVEAFFYFFLYTTISSIPFLCSFLWISASTSESPSFFEGKESMSMESLYLMLLVMLVVKMPLFFTHFWLPKAHVEAPAIGSMILAALLLKMGGYGTVRLLPFLPESNWIKPCLLSLSLLGALATSVMCLTNFDVKSVIAYSSVSHMNLVISSLLTNSTVSVSGSLVMMVTHGLVSSSFFFLTDVLYKRTNSRSLMINKHSILSLPNFSMVWFISTIFNLGLPPTLGSVSELMMMMSLLKISLFLTVLLVSYLFFTAFYSVNVYSQVNLGSKALGSTLWPLSLKELCVSWAHIGPMTVLPLALKMFLL